MSNRNNVIFTAIYFLFFLFLGLYNLWLWSADQNNHAQLIVAIVFICFAVGRTYFTYSEAKKKDKS